ncbi:hypothetical protein [Aporhodopirellula aestuarii]|uniref:FecR protein n=1 Tax=Aporhodopirellula aestuarii TaxID=2950107 RepID=A0ABT0U514_9BACT|nr:hypothetical protein [Aporhodopirellula aestuarii]MCM2371769.1 hypothetical protein [Aporhodopirellula aestuarii]
MTENELDDFLEMVAAYQDGGLAGDELARFESDLLADAQRRRLFAEVQLRSAAICEQFRTEAFSMNNHQPTSASEVTRLRSRRRVWLLAVAVAVAASIAIAFIAPSQLSEIDQIAGGPVSNKSGVAAPADGFATITYASHVTWDGEVPETSLASSRLSSRVNYRLSSGSVRLSMNSGAIVSLAAPASFTGIGPDEIELQAGKLAARMPNETSTLVVRAGDTIVRDRGNAFGITAGANGDVDLSVFDGSVSVERSRGTTASESQMVKEGESIEWGASERRAVAFSGKQYEDLWPLTVGINEASNLIDFVPPGPLGSLDRFANDSKLLLIPEKLNHRLNAHNSIAAIRPAESYPETKHARITLAPGKPISSYLLVYLPEERWEGNRHTISGSVSFQKPIIGVVVGQMALKKSDLLFGVPEIKYDQLKFRYLEDVTTEDGTLPPDSLRVSDDGKSLYFNLNVGAGQDNLRVLVDESASP